MREYSLRVLGVSRTASGIILLLVLCSIMFLVPETRMGVAIGPLPTPTGTDFLITADGDVVGTDKIQRTGDVYTFTGNLEGSLVVQKGNIIIDGAGYSLVGDGNFTGILVSYVNGVTIKNVAIRAFTWGIRLVESSNSVISGCSVTGTSRSYGIQLDMNCHNNIIHGNRVTAHGWLGIVLFSSSNNEISANYIADNVEGGLVLSTSSNNVLRNNQFVGNNVNFKFEGGNDAPWNNDIDTSNTVDGKPVYFWVNQHDKIVPSNAGYIAMTNCTNIKVQNLNIAHNHAGVLMYFTNNSKINNNDLADNEIGINLYYCQNVDVTGNRVTSSHDKGISVGSSSNVSISENHVSANNVVSPSFPVGVSLSSSKYSIVNGNNITENSQYGIQLVSSSENVVSNNYVAKNGVGIYINFGGNNLIIGNTITENNGWGMRLSSRQDCPGNAIYHNNFINNKVSEGLQVSNPWFFGPESNAWDNGKEGNYWSDYRTRYPNASEIGSSGIGNTPFYINENNIDHYPLWEPYVIPEFPSSLALAMLMLLALPLVFYVKKKSSKKKGLLPMNLK